MHYFDGVLNTRKFVAGEFFSMADITVIGGLSVAAIVKLPVPAVCEALRAWYARIQERPSVNNRVTMSDLPNSVNNQTARLDTMRNRSASKLAEVAKRRQLAVRDAD